MKYASSFILIALAACQSSSDDPIDRQHANIAKLSFDAPATWQRKDTRLRTSSTSVWTPLNNAAKESITVIRTQVHLKASAGLSEVEQLLLKAQTGLREAHVSAPSQVSSASGLRGVQVNLDYIPSNMTTRYHRVHAVLRDGDALIHVFYTAVEPDENNEAFRLVLNSLRHEEV